MPSEDQLTMKQYLLIPPALMIYVNAAMPEWVAL
jgi:hypothetical protein